MSILPPLFVQLSTLYRDDDNEYVCWKENARWIRFEEQAEEVLGRWSKPHVATLPHTSIDDLKDLVYNGTIILNAHAKNFTEIVDILANELLEYFSNFSEAKSFAELMCLPFKHHHEKRIKKTISGSSLIKNNNNVNFGSRKDTNLNSSNNILYLGSNLSNNKSSIKYQYSFTDSILTDESSRNIDFKENLKFKKKVHRQSEGASVLVMPVNFVNKSKLVFLRLEIANEISGICEVRLKTKFIVLIIGSIDRKIQLYEIGRAISTCLADDICRELFYYAKCKQDIIETLKQFNKNTMVIPPSEWNPKIRIEPPEKFMSKEERKCKELAEFLHEQEIVLDLNDDPSLKSSLKPFSGLVFDLKQKIKFYSSDFTGCFNLQSLATTLYMYLVSLCTLVAFGGLFGQKTDNTIATIECILSGSMCGILFSLFSGQPLNIISATGPVLILESIINSLCEKYDWDFLQFRLWIGLWTAFFLLLLVIFNLSFLIKYITRFTEDCFATLVAIVFIIDAIRSVLKLKKSKIKLSVDLIQIMNSSQIEHQEYLSTVTINQANSIEYRLLEAKQESRFYFSVILFLISFVLCLSLKNLKKKPFLPTKIRDFLSDFSVMIAIIITSLFDYYMGINTYKLIIPSKFQPTINRSWIVPFFSSKTNINTILFSTIPAVIVTILIFMDQQITAVISNRKELKLKKSHGYHLDLFIIAISIVLCSILGLPWFVAATVLTLTHINSLKIMSENTAPGERPVFIGIREQRGSNLFMSILIGLSVFLTRILSYIPMTALYGVFMFMGVSALNGMQFVERVLILFMPNKYQPDFKYLRHVKTKRVHLFTIIQLLSTGALFLIKYIDLVAISFPVLIAATCGIRKILDYVFSQEELSWLDDILPGKKLPERINIGKKDESFLRNLMDEQNCEHNTHLKKLDTESMNHKNVFICPKKNQSYFDLQNDNDQIIDFIDSNSFLENNDKNKNKIEFNIHNESLDKYSTHFLNIG